ncbi:Ig-like domain-containing protein [Methanobrevibacter sp.]|uniref:Ig-like domain-containing protein n=1 Tax=Methanobrevibacter sp. TaxID=66852 RepID=UPI00388E84E9
MKKHLFVISFVLIFLLAIGAVCANDDYNLTDDSAAPVLGVYAVQSDVLSDDEAPSVDVDDVTINEGEIVSIPFNVTDSNGNPVSGGVNVTIYGENETISRYIELNNNSGQSNFTIVDFVEIIRANPGRNISDIYDIIYSSWNFTNVNISQIISGLEDIDAGYSINISDLADGTDHIVNGTRVDVDKVIEGVNYIINGTEINISDVISGFAEIKSGIDVNDLNITKATNILIAILDGFEFNDPNLLNNILANIVINMDAFLDGLKSLSSEFGDGSQTSIQDLMSRLGLKLSLNLKLRLGILYLKKEFPLLEAVNLMRDIWNYNALTKEIFLDKLSVLTNGFTFNLSKFVESDGGFNLDPFYKLIGSARFDTNGITNSIVNSINSVTFDKSKVAYELADITGFDSSKIMKFLEGAVDIYHGFEFDSSSVIVGLTDIFNGFDLDNPDVFNKELLSAFSFNDKSFGADFDKILANFNYTRADVSNNVSSIINRLNLTITDELDAALSDALNRDKLNFTELGQIFRDIIDYNNITSSNFIELLGNVTNGFTFDLSDIIYKIANHDFNISKPARTIFNIIRYVEIDYNKIFESINGTSAVNFDYSLMAGGFVKLFDGVKVNVSTVMDGINKIFHEIDYNKSKVIEILDNAKNKVDITPSKINDGLTKIINAISFDKSRIYDGLAIIVSAFSFNRSSAYGGLEEIVSAFKFYDSLIDGVYKVANGLGINTSSAISQFVLKFGYVATFPQVLSPGTYDIAVAYIDDEGHVAAVNDTSKLVVLPKMNTPIDFDVLVDGYHVYINGSVDSDAEGFVLFKMGDWDVYNLVVDGKVAFDDVFKPGEYGIDAIYLGDFNFNENSTFISYIVKSATEVVVSSQINTVYGDSKNIVVTLKDEDNNPVAGKEIAVKLNGVTYPRTTNANGQISVAVPSNLKPATYAASVVFAGDSYYVKSTGSVKVVVAKATPVITAKAKTFKMTVKTKAYAITLKNNKNNAMKQVKVTIKVNGKVYSAKTNSKGKATFKITKLTKKGTFKAVVTYAGDAYYKKVTKKVNISVK